MDLTTLSASHVDRIWRAARARTPDDHAAWDCVQEAFATALASEREPAGDPVAWLCGIARNHARHWERGRDRWHKAIARSAERLRPDAPEVDQAALHDALAQLPLEQRDAVVLRYLTGRSFREVAEAQGISESAAKARVRRGLVALRARLGAATLALLLLREAEAGTGIKVVAAATAGVAMKKHLAVGLVLLALLGAGAGLVVARRNASESVRAARPARDHARADTDPAPQPAGSLPPVAAPAFVVRVVDAATRAAVPGALVTGARWEDAPPIRTATTDENGESRVAPFHGSLRVRALGYLTWRRTVAATAGGLTVALRPAAPVRGRVVWKGTARGVGGATVRLTDAESADRLDTVTTDASGSFLLAGAVPGMPFVVEASRDDLAPAARMLLRAGREILIELGGGGVLTGRVLGLDGKPSAGATVSVRPVGRSAQLLPAHVETYNTSYDARVTTNEQGRFRLAGLRTPAAYEVIARDDERAEATAEPAAFARAGETVWRELRLESRTTVVIRLDVPDTEPRPQTSFSLWRDGKSVGFQGGGHVRVLEEGGDYEVLALARNWPAVRIPIRVREGRRNVVRIPMSREGRASVSGRALNERGDPIRDVAVRFGTRAKGTTTATGIDGWFHLYDLPVDAGRLVVTDERGIHEGWSRDGVKAGDGPFVIRLPVRARFVGRFDPVPDGVRVHSRYLHHRFTKDFAISTRRLRFDESGHFEIPWSPGRRIHLTFEPARGAAVAFDEPPLAVGEARDLGIVRIDPGQVAEGVVLDGDGAPVEGARLVVDIEGVFRDRVAYTDAKGRFRLAGLPHIPLRIEVTAAGLLRHERDLRDGSELHLQTIRMRPAGVLAGRLTRGGRPLPATEFDVVPLGGGETHSAETDSVGSFEQPLPPGRYRLAFGERRGPEVEIVAKRTTRADFALD
jgi:RNA polymerase sigma-70 factor (ECF subfamily)